MTAEVDVAIVGAGPAGLALAAALGAAGLSTTLIERRAAASVAAPVDDGREIALTRHSVGILERLGAWARVPPEAVAPLREARVLNGASPYALRLDPAFERVGADGAPLGRFVANHVLRRALFEAASAQTRPPALRAGAVVSRMAVEGTRILFHVEGGDTVAARLGVLADSRLSPMRAQAGIEAQVTRFDGAMVLCRMRHTRPHHAISTAWFDYGRQLSILPLRGNRCSAVLALPRDEAASLLDADDAAFSARVTRLFGGRLGAMTKDGSAHAAEVVCTYAKRFRAPRLALVGDAAVGMHPVTAQGFNLGLLGTETLARLVVAEAAAGRDIGAAPMLAAYEDRHRRATRIPYEATVAIVRLYGTDLLPARVLRGAGLRLANTVPLLRRAVLARMTEA